ncbi:MAG: two-component system response regulator [Alphaproteobacteria bacterium]|nr:two-component system response regulator [Alphaproteobacteria bacterium]
MPDQRSTILIVDDETMNLTLLGGILGREHATIAVRSGEEALRVAVGSPRPDLILLDIMMPGMDGYEVCRRLKADSATADIPIIFITGLSDSGEEAAGLALGAADYVTKPISPAIVSARVKIHLDLKKAHDQLRNQNLMLEQKVAERTWELAVTQDATIISLATLAEERDPETGNHILRTQHYVKILADQLARNPRHAPFLDVQTIEAIFKSAPLHDIGKVAIPDQILLKPGKLSLEEFEVMKTHSARGGDALERALMVLGTSSFLGVARDIAYGHHEKWDGTGYPNGVKGEAIPLAARLMAVADVYDALVSPRVYKKPMSHEEAMSIIVGGRGTHFDPDVIDAFLNVASRFRDIAVQLKEPASVS